MNLKNVFTYLKVGFMVSGGGYSSLSSRMDNLLPKQNLKPVFSDHRPYDLPTELSGSVKSLDIKNFSSIWFSSFIAGFSDDFNKIVRKIIKTWTCNNSFEILENYI